jgi:hypothetical protein
MGRMATEGRDVATPQPARVPRRVSLFSPILQFLLAAGVPMGPNAKALPFLTARTSAVMNVVERPMPPSHTSVVRTPRVVFARRVRVVDRSGAIIRRRPSAKRP